MFKLSELVSDPKKRVAAFQEALARGMTLKRFLKVQGRNGSGVRYYKPAPAGRKALLARKLQARLDDGQGEARYVTPPPAAMVEARERR